MVGSAIGDRKCFNLNKIIDFKWFTLARWLLLELRMDRGIASLVGSAPRTVDAASLFRLVLSAAWTKKHTIDLKFKI